MSQKLQPILISKSGFPSRITTSRKSISKKKFLTLTGQETQSTNNQSSRLLSTYRQDPQIKYKNIPSCLILKFICPFEDKLQNRDNRIIHDYSKTFLFDQNNNTPVNKLIEIQSDHKLKKPFKNQFILQGKKYFNNKKP